MRYGSPHSSGYGEPENHFQYAFIDTASLSTSGYTSFIYRFKLRSGWGNSFVLLYVNGKRITNVWTPEGQEMLIRLPVPFGSKKFSVLPLRIGHLADDAYSATNVARALELKECDTPTLDWLSVPEIMPLIGDGGYTSAWVLNGLEQGLNCALVENHNSWGRLALDLAVATGIVTVTLTFNGTIVAQGSATILGVPFTVTLDEQNDSGLSGSCTVSNTVVTTAGATLTARWPVSYKIKRGTVNPPTVVIDTVAAKIGETFRWTEPAALANNVYYYRIVPVTDTSEDGTPSAVLSVVVAIAPEPPTALQYVSGAAAATVIKFKNSATAGATYNLYGVAAIGGVPSMIEPLASYAAGTPSAWHTETLPAITGYAGIAYFILRATSGGVEEKNCATLALEYDGTGVYVPARPNTPVLNLANSSIVGKAASLFGTYDHTNETGVATILKLFVRTPGGSYNFAAPVGTGGTLAAFGNIKSGTVAYTFPANGFYYVTLLAATAGGTLSDPANLIEQQIYVSDDVPAGVSTPEIQLTRS